RQRRLCLLSSSRGCSESAGNNGFAQKWNRCKKSAKRIDTKCRIAQDCTICRGGTRLRSPIRPRAHADARGIVRYAAIRVVAYQAELRLWAEWAIESALGSIATVLFTHLHTAARAREETLVIAAAESLRKRRAWIVHEPPGRARLRFGRRAGRGRICRHGPYPDTFHREHRHPPFGR